MQQLEGGVAAFKEDRFGDFNLEAGRSQPAVRERAKDGFVERAAVELDRRDVDGDADVLGPVRRLRARLPHDPGADRDDESRVFGYGYEIRRGNLPAGRMIPANQRLERADAVL